MLNYIKENLRQYGLIVALIVIAIIFHILTNGTIFRPANITSLILQNSYILILAIGMILVIVTGRIDLSVGSVAAFSGALAGVLIVQQNWPVWLAIIVTLLAGALIGAWHGFWIAAVGVPFFVVTLGGMLIFRGATMLLLDGLFVGPFPASFQMMAAGFIPDFFGGTDFNIMAVVVCIVLAVIFVLLELRKRFLAKKYDVESEPLLFFIIKLVFILTAIGLFAYWFGASNGIPNILIVLSIMILLYSYIANRTILGRHIYATGGSADTSKLSGIKVKRIVFLVYTNMGLLAALAGLVFTARLNSAMPRAGDGFELEAIAAAFIGGASPYGGVGKVSGAIIGAMVVGIINNGMNILGVPVEWQQVTTGLVLLSAVIFDVYIKNRSDRPKQNDALSTKKVQAGKAS
ncbi:MAG: sugar ABC transporter permease [Lachnospiraceae bacterium]|nr:sugar ABC transporter permease [Lachnospiraceae bacterium]